MQKLKKAKLTMAQDASSVSDTANSNDDKDKLEYSRSARFMVLVPYLDLMVAEIPSLQSEKVLDDRMSFFEIYRKYECVPLSDKYGLRLVLQTLDH
jgi:hypothetical protein